MRTAVTGNWTTEPGARIEGDRPLDRSKVQAPGVVALPGGGYRLFYTGVGPGRPYPEAQGYILSAVSDDGLAFHKEPGIRVGPDPAVPHCNRRTLAPTVTRLPDGRWRMYFESRGPADRPTVICSAISSDLVGWAVEDGIRLQAAQDIGGPRYLPLADGRGRLHVFDRATRSIVSAVTSDGLQFHVEPGRRLQGGQTEPESSGITAAEVVAPVKPGEPWVMVYSAWQDVPPGTVVPPHPSTDPNAGAADFAAASIAADMAGYRSRIFAATSTDGLTWQRSGLLLEGDGHGRGGIEAVHAEDMSLVRLPDGRYRMYFAACDAHGNWRVASAISGQP
jgi:hypothetical protein